MVYELESPAPRALATRGDPRITDHRSAGVGDEGDVPAPSVRMRRMRFEGAVRRMFMKADQLGRASLRWWSSGFAVARCPRRRPPPPASVWSAGARREVAEVSRAGGRDDVEGAGHVHHVNPPGETAVERPAACST